MADDNSNEWTQPEQPPPPLFTNDKEEDLVKQINDELIERVIGQRVLYFPIDMENTEFHPVYGEAIEKNFKNPIQVAALVEWGGIQTSHEEDINFDKQIEIDVHFHRRRLSEDKELFVKEGDFLLYENQPYEIHSTEEARQIFGRSENRLDITAHCMKARRGVFDVQ